LPTFIPLSLRLVHFVRRSLAAQLAASALEKPLDQYSTDARKERHNGPMAAVREGIDCLAARQSIASNNGRNGFPLQAQQGFTAAQGFRLP
jgi:hypothetical protein